MSSSVVRRLIYKMEHSIDGSVAEGDSNPSYIGKSKHPERTPKRHVYDASQIGLDYPVHCKIQKLISENRGIHLTIIEDKLSSDEVDNRKRYWISVHRKTCKLSNLAEGGEGGRATTEGIEKIRQTHLGSRRSPETRRKISGSPKGSVFTAEHRMNLSIARRGRVVSEETKRKMSETSCSSTVRESTTRGGRSKSRSLEKR